MIRILFCKVDGTIFGGVIGFINYVIKCQKGKLADFKAVVYFVTLIYTFFNLLLIAQLFQKFEE